MLRLFVPALFFSSLLPSEVLHAQTSVPARVQQESVQRLETSMTMARNIAEGQKLLQAEEFDRARERFQYVFDNSGPAESAAELKEQARQGLLAVHYGKAKVAERANDFPSVYEELVAAKRLDPLNKQLDQSIARAEKLANPLQVEFPGNKAATPELQETVNRIQQLLREGDQFSSTGQYNRARARYDAVLVIDPYNKAAMGRIEKIQHKQYLAATEQYKTQRQKALSEASAAWTPRLPLPVVQDAAIRTEGVESTRLAEMMDKLEKIRIPELLFNDVDITDAVNYLQEQSQALDPDKVGVNIVLKAEPTEISGATTPGGPAAAPVAPPIRSVNLNLRDVPLMQVLELLTSTTNMQFKVDEFAVVILPLNESAEVIQVKTFSGIPSTFFPEDNTEDRVGQRQAAVDVTKQLEEKGVQFPVGTKASWLPRTKKLVVRNTLNQLDFIDRLITQDAGQPIPQIEIETKFIEFTEDKLKDLSFNYRMNIDQAVPLLPQIPGLNGEPFRMGTGNAYGPANLFGPNAVVPSPPGNSSFPQPLGRSGTFASTDGLRGVSGISQNSLDQVLGLGGQRNPNVISLAGVVNGNGFRFLMSAIESTLGGNLMSAPKVVVQSGASTKVEVVRDFRYPDPNGYDPPEIPQAAGGSSTSLTTPGSSGIVIPATPTSFIDRGIGVILNVRQARAEGGLIEMQLEPEVTDFDGFINYASPITNVSYLNGAVTVVSDSPLLAPVFSTRKVTTVVEILDGQTLVMGGLIDNQVQEVNDKVPVLGDIPWVGRLFRSKSSQDVKKNLLIFVTARTVRPDGRPENLSLTEQERLEVSQILAE
jgi:general secretion pathway protein D